MNQFIVYSKPHCPYCETAKRNITKNGDQYTEQKLNTDITIDEIRVKFPNAKTFPIITLNEQMIGGTSDLNKWYVDQSIKDLQSIASGDLSDLSI